jgi:hypothetical protein
MTDTPPDPAEELSRQAEQPAPSLLREFASFLREEKQWWLVPLLLALLLLAGLVVLTGTGVGAWLYALF